MQNHPIHAHVNEHDLCLSRRLCMFVPTPITFCHSFAQINVMLKQENAFNNFLCLLVQLSPSFRPLSPCAHFSVSAASSIHTNQVFPICFSKTCNVPIAVNRSVKCMAHVKCMASKRRFFLTSRGSFFFSFHVSR